MLENGPKPLHIYNFKGSSEGRAEAKKAKKKSLFMKLTKLLIFQRIPSPQNSGIFRNLTAIIII